MTKFEEPVTDAAAIAESYVPPAVGRPSVIDDTAIVAKLLDLLAQGLHVEPACALAGLNKATYYRWIQAAEQDERDGRQETSRSRFREAVQKARAQAEHGATAALTRAWQAGPQYWTAAATYLERSYPDRWGRKATEENGPRVVVQIGTQTASVSLAIPSQSDNQSYVNLQVVDNTSLAPVVPSPVVLRSGARAPVLGTRGGRVGRPPKKHQA